MEREQSEIGRRSLIDLDGLQGLFDALARHGYRVVGPRIRDGAIGYDDISTVGELPAGWTDRQDAGTYRLERRGDEAFFGYAVGPHSWKQFLHPPVQRLWRAERSTSGTRILPEPVSQERFAFIGVRSCELHAIAIQDRVFTGGAHIDRHYSARREGAFIVALNCSTAGGTCFCVSMQTGPKAETGFDLSLTELIDDDGHRFMVETGSPRGADILKELSTREASAHDLEAAERLIARTARSMGRHMETDGIHTLLLDNLDHPRWDDVAARCLSCANCTMVCPTCFCTSVEDSSDLEGDIAARSQRWDSCFTLDFSYIHGGSVRSSAKSRYRQWMTHKLATWIDQFGSSGCVGCGRCISWCPVGIDITEEVDAIRGAGTPVEEDA